MVYDADPNLTNVLIDEDFKIWRVDFSRGFRLYKDLQSTKDLVPFAAWDCPREYDESRQ